MSTKESRAIVDAPLRALMWMGLSSFGFACMSAGVKNLAGVIPPPQLVFFRAAVNFVIVAVWIKIQGEDYFPKHSIKLLTARGLAGFMSVSCLFYGISTLPLSVASLINWSSPIFVLIFSRLFLKERLPGRSYAFVVVALSGLLLLVNPFADFEAIGPGYLFSVMITLLGAAFGALAYVAVRAATARVGVNVIIFYFTGISTLLSIPLVVRDFRIPNWMSLFQLLWIGLFATLGQFAMTQGYRFAKAGLVSTMGLLTAAFSMVLGHFIFQDRFDALQWAGVTLLSFGVIGTTLTNSQKSDILKVGRGVS